MARTPKKVGPKSSKDFENKSQRNSVDEPSYSHKMIKKGSKGPGFDKKVKMFMDKSEIDRDLEEKVKRKLLEISKTHLI